jgi:nucleoside-diphosphate-sugar epimerase
MIVLFIGGTGNISTECATLLHKRGHEILILSRGRIQVPSGYRSIQADRKNAEAMRFALKSVKPDIVVNFLGYDVSDIEADYALFNGSIRQYIFISSATVYEKPPRKIPIIEDTPLENQWWDYAQKKIDSEKWLEQRSKESGFPLTIVRPSHTYSNLWIPNAISSSSYTFASRLEQCKPVFVHDDGETAWTLTAASDFAVGLAGLVGNDKAIGEAFHITGDEVLTWNQIYAEIADAVGAKSPQIVKVPTDFICKIAPDLTGNLKGDKAHPGVFDNSKIKRFVPEFQTRKPFRVGVRESVAWLRAHPDQQNLSFKVDETIDSVIAAWHAQRSDG